MKALNQLHSISEVILIALYAAYLQIIAMLG